MPSKDTLAVAQNLGLTENQKKDRVVMIKAMQRYTDGHMYEMVAGWNVQQ